MNKLNGFNNGRDTTGGIGGVNFNDLKGNMTHKEALKVLDYHARWRKDKSDKMVQIHPERLTEALEVAIKLLKEKTKQMK